MAPQMTVFYLNLKSVKSWRVFNRQNGINLLKKIFLKMPRDSLPVGSDELNDRVKLCCKLIFIEMLNKCKVTSKRKNNEINT